MAFTQRSWKHAHTKPCVWVLIRALFITANAWMQPRCPALVAQTSRGAYYLVFKRNEMIKPWKDKWRKLKCWLTEAICKGCTLNDILGKGKLETVRRSGWGSGRSGFHRIFMVVNPSSNGGYVMHFVKNHRNWAFCDYERLMFKQMYNSYGRC